MSIHLEGKDLVNAQQMEVAVNGPDGATHLILCAGVVELGPFSNGIYTFLVGPQISRRQFVGAIASGALSAIHDGCKNGDNNYAAERETTLVLINADYDEEACRVMVSAEVSSTIAITKLAISYNVSILAELPRL